MTKNKLFVFIIVMVAVLFLSSFDRSHVKTLPAPNIIPLADQGALCMSCHEDIVSDYQESNKSASFLRPSMSNGIEDFGGLPYFHKPSKSYFEMTWDTLQMTFSRYQINKPGEKINLVKYPVDWILGSGDDLRTYLYQTENGELFLLPLAWYSDLPGWGMAPGYINELTISIEKPLTGECMFCHNSYPGEGTSSLWSSTYFPHDLPQGIDCSRCHGDAQNHINLAVLDSADTDAIKSSIINPVRLNGQVRDDVCNQCHLQPSVAVDAERIFGRDVFSFKPGEPLSEYRIEIDITNNQRSGERSFEKNHHAYQLYQSQCYLSSEGAMSCMTCHDVHRTVPAIERVDHYRDKCLNCHDHTQMLDTHEWKEEAPADDNCVSCHMPERRTYDFIHLKTTDHNIRIVNDLKSLVVEREEEDMVVQNVMTYNLPELDTTKKVYLAVAVLKMRKKQHILAYVKKLLTQTSTVAIEPFLYVAEAEMVLDKNEEALETIDSILQIVPNHPIAIEWKGLTLMKLNRMDEARSFLEEAIRISPNRAETFYNLGLYQFYHDELELAKESFENSIALRSNMKISWYYLSLVNYAMKSYIEAEQCAIKALEIDPVHTRSYIALKDALVAQGKKNDARSYLEHAYRVVQNELVIARELNKLSE